MLFILWLLAVKTLNKDGANDSWTSKDKGEKELLALKS